MGAMVRKQVYIEPGQDRFLKRRANELGVTEAELICRAIDYLAQSPARTRIDPEGWAAVIASMEERARLPTTGERRSWRRKDLYEERLGSFGEFLVDTNVLVSAYAPGDPDKASHVFTGSR
jgi:hypothetical protein